MAFSQKLMLPMNADFRLVGGFHAQQNVVKSAHRFDVLHRHIAAARALFELRGDFGFGE
jgi:hypothetical protein